MIKLNLRTLACLGWQVCFVFIDSCCSTKLDYHSCNLNHIPTAPPNNSVTELDCYNNNITELNPAALNNYDFLNVLNVGKNSVTHIRDGSFDHIHNLKELILMYNPIESFPISFGPSMTVLETIEQWRGYSNPSIFTFPYYAAFTNVKKLNLGGPSMLAGLNFSMLPPHVKEFYLLLAGLNRFPDLSTYSPNVTDLNVKYNSISFIPDKDISRLVFLTVFLATRNKIENFPNFSHCRRLVKLDMDMNKITHIPREHVQGLFSLVTFYVAKNLLASMPNVSNLAELKNFRIGYNQITEILKDHIYGLKNLRRLHCEYNKILHLPDLSILLPRLKHLQVQGNKLKTLPDLYDILPTGTLYTAENPYVCDHPSLCWVRMLSWLKPDVDILKDTPVCDQPMQSNGINVTRVHPAFMQCYKGK